MKRIKITVTKQDIEKGKRHSMSACPIAFAIRKVEGFEKALVGSSVYRKQTAPVDLPLSAKSFIFNFDLSVHQQLARPFTFTLQIP